MESTTAALPTSPSATSVEASPMMTPAPFSPTMAINSPIPAEIPYFRFAGTEFTSASRNLNRERMMKMMPSTKIAARATFQGSWTPISFTIGTTEYAK
ncbi:Uncharacterised protein [uncultured Ruminococcus sp.]|nr:Uncharacterised protein [uncultured Ruminococcus sp.]